MFLSVIISSVSQRLPLKVVMGAGSELPKCFGGKYCTEILAMIPCPSLEGEQGWSTCGVQAPMSWG